MRREEKRRGEKQRDKNRRQEGVNAEKIQHRDQIEKEHLEKGPGCNGQRERRKPRKFISLRLREKSISKR